MFEDLFDDALESSFGDDLDSYLIADLEDEEGALENAVFNTEEFELTAAEESAIFLDSVYSTCDSPEEFIDMVEENATVWEMYGLIQDATAATEAVKKMKIDNWKSVNLSRVAAREAIRQAQRANSADYKKYAKFRGLFKKYRDKILKMFGTRSKAAAKKSIANSQRKLAAIKPTTAKKKAQSTDLMKKMERVAKGLDKNGRNGRAIRENGR